MNIFPETLDPDETKPYEFDWAGQIESGDSLASQVITLVSDGGGATVPSESIVGTESRIFLTGGTSGQQIVFTVRVITTNGLVLEEAFGVNVLATTDTAAVESDVDRITRELKEIRAYRHEIATGEAVIRMSRNGRSMMAQRLSIDEYNKLIRELESDLSKAKQLADGKPARRPMKLRYHR